MKNTTTLFLIIFFLLLNTSSFAQKVKWFYSLALSVSQEKSVQIYDLTPSSVHKNTPGFALNFGGGLCIKLSNRFDLETGLKYIDFREKESGSQPFYVPSSTTGVVFHDLSHHSKLRFNYLSVPFLLKYKSGKASFNLGFQQMFLLKAYRKSNYKAGPELTGLFASPSFNFPFFTEKNLDQDPTDFGFLIGFSYFIKPSLAIDIQVHVSVKEQRYQSPFILDDIISRHQQVSIGFEKYLY